MLVGYRIYPFPTTRVHGRRSGPLIGIERQANITRERRHLTLFMIKVAIAVLCAGTRLVVLTLTLLLSQTMLHYQGQELCPCLDHALFPGRA